MLKNPYLIKENKAQIVEIREIKRQENYQANWFAKKILSTADYCKDSLCGCFCSSSVVSLSSDIVINKRTGSSFTAHGRKWQKEIDPTGWDELVLKAAGTKDLGASGQISASAFGYKNSGGELKVLSGTASGEVTRKSIKGKLSADLYNVKADGIQMRVGVAADTGISVEDDLEVKAGGFGFVLGKQIGVSLPVGEIKVDTEDCIIQ